MRAFPMDSDLSFPCDVFVDLAFYGIHLALWLDFGIGQLECFFHAAGKCHSLTIISTFTLFLDYDSFIA